MDRQYGFAMDLNTDQTLGYNVQTDELLNQKNSVYYYFASSECDLNNCFC